MTWLRVCTTIDLLVRLLINTFIKRRESVGCFESALRRLAIAGFCLRDSCGTMIQHIVFILLFTEYERPLGHLSTLNLLAGRLYLRRKIRGQV